MLFSLIEKSTLFGWIFLFFVFIVMKITLKEFVNIIREEIYKNKNEYWYHGTNVDFDRFDIKYFGGTDDGWWGYGIYFHSEKDRGGYGNIVKVAKLNFKNPIVLPMNGDGKYLFDILSKKIDLPLELSNDSSMNIIRRVGNKKFTNTALELGFDGMIIPYVQGTKEAVVFDDNIIEIVDTIK